MLKVTVQPLHSYQLKRNRNVPLTYTIQNYIWIFMDRLPYPFTIRQEMMDAPPDAYALVNGSAAYPDITGIVRFYDTPYQGILLYAE